MKKTTMSINVIGVKENPSFNAQHVQDAKQLRAEHKLLGESNESIRAIIAEKFGKTFDIKQFVVIDEVSAAKLEAQGVKVLRGLTGSVLPFRIDVLDAGFTGKANLTVTAYLVGDKYVGTEEVCTVENTRIEQIVAEPVATTAMEREIAKQVATQLASQFAKMFSTGVPMPVAQPVANAQQTPIDISNDAE